MLLSVFVQNPVLAILLFIALVITLTIHEFAHAYVAYRLGDDTPKMLGRVTLNPLAHLDPLGTLLIIVSNFGWGRPVPFNPYNLKHPKRDTALIALAGPASNFILAIIASVVFHSLGLDQSFLGSFLYLLVVYNVSLCIFNLLPINPLDGYKVVLGVLPNDYAIQWAQIAPYGIYILLLLIFTDTTRVLLSPVYSLFLSMLGF